ncbi:hypothetical protein V8C26DRAFT_88974 [Trichoderma gracile]
MFRPARDAGPSIATAATSSSRSAHRPMPESVCQTTNDAFTSHTSAAPTFQRPRRFLLLAREKLGPATTPTTPGTRGNSRAGPRLVDSIESDGETTGSASHDRQKIVPQSRKISNNPGPANRPVASASSLSSSSRVAQRPIPQSERASDVEQVDTSVAASFSSRVAQRTIPQIERNAGPSDMESSVISLTSANRGSRPVPLPGIRNPRLTRTSTTPASYAAYQPIPQPARHTEPARTAVASTRRVAQQPIHQPTRDASPTHTSTSSTSRMPRQPTTQPSRTSSSHAPPASLSRTTQQSTFRPMRATATPLNTPTSSASASILEFICLYTHDLRRKKKRWQDGKLKFHTFNKKYMVYDDGGGFVGDGHWQGDEAEVAEGLEMNLDRGMAIVQLLECTGSREQDLGEVLGKRVREVEGRRLSAAAKVSPSAASPNPAKRSRGVETVVETPPPTTLATVIAPPPRSREPGPAVVVETSPPTTVTTTAPLPPRNGGTRVTMVVKNPPPTTGTTMNPLPPRNGGAWSTHAMDLMGMNRPTRG